MLLLYVNKKSYLKYWYKMEGKQTGNVGVNEREKKMSLKLSVHHLIFSGLPCIFAASGELPDGSVASGELPDGPAASGEFPDGASKCFIDFQT